MSAEMLVQRLFYTGWPEKQTPRVICMNRGVNTESDYDLVFEEFLFFSLR